MLRILLLLLLLLLHHTGLLQLLLACLKLLEAAVLHATYKREKLIMLARSCALVWFAIPTC
jgi:hypothetical protein